MVTRTYDLILNEIRSDEERTIKATLSSEFPVMRRDGEEILIHDDSSVDLTRVPLPLLVSHDQRDLPVGVVEDVNVKEGKLSGLLRFGSSSRAKEVWEDIQTGILRNLSIGYQVLKTAKVNGGYKVTRWQPFEVSIVSVPADITVGINRSQSKETKTMDRNDILKARTRAVEELETLASAETLDDEAIQERKTEIETLDKRLAVLNDLDALKDRQEADSKRPALSVQTREAIRVIEGPALSAEDKTFRRMFGEPPNGHGFETSREFMEVISSGRYDPRLRTMTEGTASAGGFAVPEEYSSKWLDDSLPAEVVRPRATVWPMKSDTLKVPGWDSHDRSSSLYGGLGMVFLSETGESTPQSGLLRQIALSTKKAAIYVDISQELHDDGVGFDAQLQAAMKKSVGYGLDDAFINGTGAGMPLGVLNSDSIIEVAAESEQTDETIVYENLTKMFSRMYPAGRQRAVWLANSSTIPQLMQTTITVGTGGSVVEIFKESSGSFSIFGRPVVFTEHLPALGNAADIAFVDLSQYVIGMRKDVSLDKSNIPGWYQDLQSYRVILRFDGMPSWHEAITPAAGSTLSWCVTLAARQSG
jgi:HK97 family phage major capsid protein/HK97 family phage prohead protease